MTLVELLKMRWPLFDPQNCVKTSFEVIHTFIDYSQRPSKYCHLQDRRIVGECGLWEPKLEASIHL